MNASSVLGGMLSDSITWKITISALAIFATYSACLIALSDISDPSGGTSILLYGEGTIDVVVDDDDLDASIYDLIIAYPLSMSDMLLVV